MFFYATCSLFLVFNDKDWVVLGQFTAGVGPCDGHQWHWTYGRTLWSGDEPPLCFWIQHDCFMPTATINCADRESPLQALQVCTCSRIIFFLGSMAGFGGVGVMLEAQEELAGWCCDQWQEQTLFSVPPY